MNQLGILEPLSVRMGLGLLRLSTEGRPSKEDAIPLIHQALEAGIRLLDTADTYGLDERDLHYGETLAREALASWHGPRDEVRVVTKAGLARPKGKWMPGGSPKQLRKAVEGSLRALGVERLFLLQLHAKDPKVPFEEQLAALAELQRQGLVQHLGLCNVGPAEVRQAQRHFQVACVQNELSAISRSSAREGMLELTRQLGIPFLAHRPLGGYAKVENLLKNRALNPVAKKLGVSPHQVALALLWDAAPQVVPLLGARRAESLQDSLAALKLSLGEPELAVLREKLSLQADAEALEAIQPRTIPEDLPELPREPGPGPQAEVVLLMGIQGAGKSQLVESYVEHGYTRLNRDLAGGKLDDLLPELEQHLAGGERRVVLDNTYPTRISRSRIITVAHRHKVPVRCRWVKTPLEEARRNVVGRMLDRYEQLLGPAEMKELARTDPNLPPPVAMQKWCDSLEPPEFDEGFSAIDEIPFVRRHDSTFTEKSLLLDVDGTLRITRSGEIYPRHPDDIELLPGRRAVLEEWMSRGYKLFFVSNQSGVASNQLSAEAARACFERTVELLGLPVEEIVFCPHPAFPVGCFCRKPMPGMGVWLQRRHRLSQEHLVVVGDMDSDARFAAGLGARYFDAGDFFVSGSD